MTQTLAGVVAWDIGGAHLKAAQCAADGRLHTVRQLPCPLWQGIDHLRAALKEAQRQMDLDDNWQHAITMTGELADCFADRASGVGEILKVAQENLRSSTEPYCFTQAATFVSLREAANQPLSVASANWLATAHFAARRVNEALLLDIGSTTSDLVAISAGQVQAQGYSDAERLRSGELLYTGVVRTPVMAVANQVPFAGEWQALAAEHFATMADIYRLTGQLPEHADLLSSADGAEKSPSASARRLARMLGRDAGSVNMAQWRRCAEFIRGVQVNTLQMGAERLFSRHTSAECATIIGAGAGRFLAQEIAARLGCDYQGMDTLFVGDDALNNLAADCAPAASLACLASERLG